MVLVELEKEMEVKGFYQNPLRVENTRLKVQSEAEGLQTITEPNTETSPLHPLLLSRKKDKTKLKSDH